MEQCTLPCSCLTSYPLSTAKSIRSERRNGLISLDDFWLALQYFYLVAAAKQLWCVSCTKHFWRSDGTLTYAAGDHDASDCLRCISFIEYHDHDEVLRLLPCLWVLSRGSMCCKALSCTFCCMLMFYSLFPILGLMWNNIGHSVSDLWWNASVSVILYNIFKLHTTWYKCILLHTSWDL